MQELVYGPFISRAQAKAQGIKRYFTGKPCKHGHIAARQTSNGECAECARVRLERRNHANPERFAREARERYQADPEKYRAKGRDFYGANTERCKAWSKAWKDKNKDQVAAYSAKYREGNPELYRINARNQYRKNPAAYKQRSAQRIMEIQQEYNALSKADQQRIDAIYATANALNARDGANSWHVDHIYPRKLGGKHHPDNLQILTATENLRKGSKYEPSMIELQKAS